MLCKMKLFVHEISLRKVFLWAIDALIVVFICYIFYVINTNTAGVEEIDNRFIVFAEEYTVRNPSMAAEELIWRVERSLATVDSGVLNSKEFSPRDERGPVLVVQAGRRAPRLQQLLASLAHVADISEALLVVSHSFYDQELVDLVRTVNFCRVLQVFFPFSSQLFPDRYPGPDRTINRSLHDAAAVEHKQQWWWTAHFLFHHYTWFAPKPFGMVLFLQEDDYVAPDALHVLKIAQRAFSYHPEAEVISLGRGLAGAADPALLALAPWQPAFERGLAFNRSLWLKLQASATDFCLYNDSSWSYSLLNAFAARSRGYADMIASAAPRVLSTREHATGRAGAKAARALLARVKLFPARMRVRFVAGPRGREARPEPAPQGAGGWAELRDQLLCLDPFLMTTHTPEPEGTHSSKLNLIMPSTYLKTNKTPA